MGSSLHFILYVVCKRKENAVGRRGKRKTLKRGENENVVETREKEKLLREEKQKKVVLGSTSHFILYVVCKREKKMQWGEEEKEKLLREEKTKTWWRQEKRKNC